MSHDSTEPPYVRSKKRLVLGPFLAHPDPPFVIRILVIDLDCGRENVEMPFIAQSREVGHRYRSTSIAVVQSMTIGQGCSAPRHGRLVGNNALDPDDSPAHAASWASRKF